MADSLGTDRKEIKGDMCNLASAVLEVDANHRLLVEKTVAFYYKPEHIVEYVHMTRSDESPMPVTRRIEENEMQLDSTAQVAQHSNAVVLHSGLPNHIPGRRSQTPSKILQSDNPWGIAVYKEDTDEFTFILGETISTPQLLERTNAECLMNG